MSLQFSDGRVFSCGSCAYEYRPATAREDSPRIMIPVRIQGVETIAMVDTGGLYLVCNQELANLLDLGEVSLVERDVQMKIPRCGGSVTGNLYLASLILLAEEGNGLELEVTAFVPRHWIVVDQDQPLAIVGWWSCLEKIRFAVDPGSDIFYFGELSDGEIG
jgi:hypothetical protein